MKIAQVLSDKNRIHVILREEDNAEKINIEINGNMDWQNLKMCVDTKTMKKLSYIPVEALEEQNSIKELITKIIENDKKEGKNKAFDVVFK